MKELDEYPMPSRIYDPEKGVVKRNCVGCIHENTDWPCSCKPNLMVGPSVIQNDSTINIIKCQENIKTQAEKAVTDFIEKGHKEAPFERWVKLSPKRNGFCETCMYKDQLGDMFDKDSVCTVCKDSFPPSEWKYEDLENFNINEEEKNEENSMF